MIDIHKAVTDAGGNIGVKIDSGEVNILLPEIKEADQTTGIVINRKFYLKNLENINEDVTFTLTSSAPFTAIIFAGTGTAQVVGDLTGLETNESPIVFTLGALASKSFWVRVTVPPLSTETLNYNKVSTKLNY